MKAVILKTEGAKAAVLDGNGSVRVIENKGYSRGQVIDIAAIEYPLEDISPDAGNEKRHGGAILKFNRLLTEHASRVAAVLAVVLLAGGLTVYAAPVKTAISDTTPSLSYHMNVFDRVVKVEARDDTGREALNHIGPRIAGKRFDKAVDIALTTLDETSQSKPEDSFTLPAEPEASYDDVSSVRDIEEREVGERHSEDANKASDTPDVKPENEPDTSEEEKTVKSKDSVAGDQTKPDISDTGSGEKKQGPVNSPVEAVPKAPDIGGTENSDINSVKPDMYSIFGQGPENNEQGQGSPDGGFNAEPAEGYGAWGSDGGAEPASEPSESSFEHEEADHGDPGYSGEPGNADLGDPGHSGGPDNADHLDPGHSGGPDNADHSDPGHSGEPGNADHSDRDHPGH